MGHRGANFLLGPMTGWAPPKSPAKPTSSSTKALISRGSRPDRAKKRPGTPKLLFLPEPIPSRKCEHRAYLRCAPREAHLGALVGLGGVGGQPRGVGVLRPPRRAEVPDLRTEEKRKHRIALVNFALNERGWDTEVNCDLTVEFRLELAEV